MDGPAPLFPSDDAVVSVPPELAAHAARVDREGAFPWESLHALHRTGLLALTARPEDGGAGAGLARAADMVRRAGQGCASAALILAMQLIHLRAAACSDWPEHLRAAVGRGAVRDGALVNALRIEPALGTPARGGLPATLARRTTEGWRLSGRKIYSTGAPGLTWMLVFARVEPAQTAQAVSQGSPGTDEAPPRMGLFLVPAQSPGITVEETWDQLGLRGSGSHDVVFADVFVPHDHAVDLRSPADWMRPDPAGVAWNTLLVAALYTGGRGGRAGLDRLLPARPRAGQSRRAVGHGAAGARGGGPHGGAAADQPPPPRRRCRRGRREPSAVPVRKRPAQDACRRERH